MPPGGPMAGIEPEEGSEAGKEDPQAGAVDWESFQVQEVHPTATWETIYRHGPNTGHWVHGVPSGPCQVRFDKVQLREAMENRRQPLC